MIIHHPHPPSGLVGLSKRDVLSLAGRPGTRIESRRGSLWITQDGDLRDVILGCGEAHLLERDGPVLVQALEPALVKVERPVKRAASAPGLWRRLSDAAFSA